MFKLLVVCHLIASIIFGADAQLSLSSIPCRSTSVAFKKELRDGRVVGGTNAERGSIPYIASLTRRGGHFCGATIINEQWLLTAAHCVFTGNDEILKPHRIRAVLGLHAISEYKNQQNTNTIDAPERAYEIQFRNIIVHPQYECKRPANDLALLEISQPITFSRTVQPICISSASNSRNKTYDNEMALISGWGFTAEEMNIVNRPDVLQNAEVQVWSNRECQTSFDQHQKTHTIQSTQMCAGKKIGGIDACWADSGSPMVSHDDGLIGIVSTGIGCARPGLPGIYTRVSEYAQWIKHFVLAN